MDRAVIARALEQAARLPPEATDNFRALRASVGPRDLDGASFLLGVVGTAFSLQGVEIVDVAREFPDLLAAYLDAATPLLDGSN